MQIRLLYVESSKVEWAENATQLYTKKISNFLKFEIVKIKSSSNSRDSKEQKIKFESEKILNALDSQDFVVLCDERGRDFSSLKLSELLVNKFETGSRSVVFVIGGAFGVSKEVQEKAQLKLKLSSFVLNHLVAKTLLLEQIYRSLCIWKRIPYHND